MGKAAAVWGSKTFKCITDKKLMVNISTKQVSCCFCCLADWAFTTTDIRAALFQFVSSLH